MVPNFTPLTAREITYNKFEIPFVVFLPDITTNHAITYSNSLRNLRQTRGKKSYQTKYTDFLFITYSVQ